MKRLTFLALLATVAIGLPASGARSVATTRLLFIPRKVSKIENLTEQQLLSILDRSSLKRKIAEHVEMSVEEKKCLVTDVDITQERNKPNLFTLTATSQTENGAVQKANAYAEILIAEYVAYRTADLENRCTSVASRRKTLLDRLAECDARLAVLGEKRRALEQETKDNEKRAVELTAMIPEYERLAAHHADMERSVRALGEELNNIAFVLASLRNDLRQIERARTVRQMENGKWKIESTSYHGSRVSFISWGLAVSRLFPSPRANSWSPRAA